MAAEMATYVLIGLSVVMAVFGLWLMLGQRKDPRERIRLRMGGVKLVRRYELGDSLAKSRSEEQKKKDQRREALKKQAFSDIPAIDLALQKTPWAEKLNGMLLQCEMPMSVTTFVLLCGLLAAIGVAVSVLWRQRLDPVLAAIFGLAMGIAPLLFIVSKVKVRMKRLSAQLPDSLDLLSSSVKGGQSLNAAFQNVADEMPEPVCDEFRILSDELMFGVNFDDALRHLVTRVKSPDMQFFATALMIQKETGGNLSEVLDGLQTTIRERFRILGQVKTLTAQGKLSGLIVGLLPVVLCVAIYFANSDYISELFTTKMGHILLSIGVGLQMMGVFMIHRIVNIEV
jgi:tight adherence protein B